MGPVSASCASFNRHQAFRRHDAACFISGTPAGQGWYEAAGSGHQCKRESPMPREQVDALFAAMWPQLESAVDEAVRNAAPSREPQRSQESCACFNRSAASKASCSSRAYISARAALWVARRSSTSPGSTWLSPKPQFRTSARTAAFALTWPAAPPCQRHTVPPGIAFALHCLPVCSEIAVH